MVSDEVREAAAGLHSLRDATIWSVEDHTEENAEAPVILWRTVPKFNVHQ